MTWEVLVWRGRRSTERRRRDRLDGDKTRAKNWRKPLEGYLATLIGLCMSSWDFSAGRGTTQEAWIEHVNEGPETSCAGCVGTKDLKPLHHAEPAGH